MIKQKTKKWVGWIILLIGITLISPIPDFFDIPGFAMYSAIKGIEVNTSNISMFYLNYLLFTVVLGAIFLILGLGMLGKNLKWVKKKLDIGHYKIALLLAVAIVGIIAFLDVKGMVYWASVTNMQDYVFGFQGVAFWNFFKTIAFALMAIVPVCYFAFVRKDKSEALGIFGMSYILWMGGLADLLFFVFQRIPIPETLPWLNHHLIIGGLSKILGNSQVTNNVLLLSVILSFIVAYSFAKVMKEKF